MGVKGSMAVERGEVANDDLNDLDRDHLGGQTYQALKDRVSLNEIRAAFELEPLLLDPGTIPVSAYSGGYLVPAYLDIECPGRRAAFYRWLYRRIGFWRVTKRGWTTVKFELFEERDERLEGA